MTMQTLKYKFGRSSRLNSPSPSPRIHEPDEIFTFNRTARPTNTVHVENVPSHGEGRCVFLLLELQCNSIPVKKMEIVSLFHTLIGKSQIVICLDIY